MSTHVPGFQSFFFFGGGGGDGGSINLLSSNCNLPNKLFEGLLGNTFGKECTTAGPPISFPVTATFKVAQFVRCRTSNQRVAGSIPGRGTLVCPWARQFIPYCFSLPSCKMGTQHK